MCLRQVLYLECVHRLIGQSWNKLMLLAIVDFVLHAMTVKAIAVFLKLMNEKDEIIQIHTFSLKMWTITVIHAKTIAPVSEQIALVNLT